MSILQRMSDKYRVDATKPASNNEEIAKLLEFSKIEIPKEYLEIISEFTEIEINIQNKKYIRIWGADGCIEMNEAYFIQKYIPESLAIGDDEGGNALIYANGKMGFGLYLVAFNDLDEDELQFIAGTLTELLIDDVGINVF